MAFVNGVTSNSEVSGDDKSIKRSAKHDITGVQDLEKVTDFAEEKELSQQDISGVCIQLVRSIRFEIYSIISKNKFLSLPHAGHVPNWQHSA